MPIKGCRKYHSMKSNMVTQIKRPSKKELIKNMLYPHRQGEIGTALSELYYFSRYRWNALFRNTGWKIKTYSSTNLFYTGYIIFGSLISIHLRQILSCLLGSSCHVFVLMKGEQTPLESKEMPILTKKSLDHDVKYEAKDNDWKYHHHRAGREVLTNGQVCRGVLQESK